MYAFKILLEFQKKMQSSDQYFQIIWSPCPVSTKLSKSVSSTTYDGLNQIVYPIRSCVTLNFRKFW